MNIKIKDIIEKLQELNGEDYKVYIKVEPEVELFENYDGTGIELTKYVYNIILESNETTRMYKNEHGIRKYLEDNNENNK